ncbi:MAG: TolC family protein [Polyangiales bacterium]
MSITRRFVGTIASVVAFSGAGCVAHSTRSDLEAVRSVVAERRSSTTGSEPKSAQLTAERELELRVDREPEQVDEEVRKLIGEPLTLDKAVSVALLNNRELRADLLELGVARGQLVQAALFPNVEFEAALRFPQDGVHPDVWDLGAAIDLTAIILRGPRSEVARAELDAARTRTAGAVLDLGYRVRLAYYDVQAAQQQVELLRTAMLAYGASYETAQELLRAGNTTDLDLANEYTAYEGARLAVAEAEADLIDARERLNVLLGLFGRDTGWQIAERLPDPGEPPRELETLENRAIAASLELAETRSSVLALARRVGFTRLAGALPDISAGVSAERHEGIWAIGPQVHGSLPWFNRQQGNRISAQAQLDVLRQRYLAQAIDIRANLRAVRDRSSSARARVQQYRETLLPLRERVVNESLLQYNAMQIGVFQLLQARRDQVEAGRSYVATLHEYWRSRAALEQLLLGRMVDPVMANTRAMSRTAAGGGGSGSGHADAGH